MERAYENIGEKDKKRFYLEDYRSCFFFVVDIVVTGAVVY